MATRTRIAKPTRTGAGTSSRTMPGTYFELVKTFPLTRIRDDGHLEAASMMIDRLLREERDEGAEAYLDVLTDLVGAYEEAHVAIPDASEAEVLRLLMQSNGLSQQKLAKAVGIAQSTISAVLNGERQLTKAHVIKLAGFFGVAPTAFLPA